MEQKFVLLAAVVLAFAATGPKAGAMPQPAAAMGTAGRCNTIATTTAITATVTTIMTIGDRAPEKLYLRSKPHSRRLVCLH